MGSPKKNIAYEFDIALIDTANTGDFKVNPTIAAGDFKVSIDNGALANLATLPVVSPAGSIIVKVSLSQAEQNGDKILVQCIDVSGAEWDDVLVFIDNNVANADDLVRSTTPANTLDVTAAGTAGINWGNVENKDAANDLSGTDIQLADTATTLTNKTGFSLSTAGILAIWHQLTSAIVTAGSVGKLIKDFLTGNAFTRIGALGAGLTAINLPNQTMDIVGDITGNLSGSVGSVTTEVAADVAKINGSATAAVQLALSANTIEDGACEGTPTTTVIQTDLAETSDDIYIGRILIFTSGNARGEATDITDYAGDTGTLTVTALTQTPVAADTFVLI